MTAGLFSVMIPTWLPDTGYLEGAIESVLRQFRPGEPVQIELVDDASPGFDPETFTTRFGAGRVTAHRNERRLGLAGNWNACIARAKHPWVHLLHQDDYLLDGFYAAMRKGIERAPGIAAACCASSIVQAARDPLLQRLVPMREPGVLEDWIEHVFVRLAIQCSAIVVRRDVYASLGGFDTDRRYTPDWDMWKRIAARHPVWFEPKPLAVFRRHPGSETSRLRAAGEHLDEVFRSIADSASLLPPGVAAAAGRRARRHYAAFAVEETALVLGDGGGWRNALRLLDTARRHTSVTTMAAAIGKVLARGAVRRTRARIRSR